MNFKKIFEKYGLEYRKGKFNPDDFNPTIEGWINGQRVIRLNEDIADDLSCYYAIDVEKEIENIIVDEISYYLESKLSNLIFK